MKIRAHTGICDGIETVGGVHFIVNGATDVHYILLLLVLLLVLKKVGSARPRESDVHPLSPETPAPQYQPIDRKKRKGKRVEDYSRDRAA